MEKLIRCKECDELCIIPPICKSCSDANLKKEWNDGYDEGYDEGVSDTEGEN